MEAASQTAESAETTSTTALWRGWGGMFRVFLDRNSDGEFALARKQGKSTSSFMLTSSSPFSSRENPGKLFGQILVSREESTAQAESSACVLEGNAQRTSEAMRPVQIPPFGVPPLCTGRGLALHSLRTRGSPPCLGRGAGRCSGSGRSCAGSRDRSAGGAASPPLRLLAGLDGFHLSCGGASRPAATSLTVDGCANLQAPGQAPWDQAQRRVGKPGGGSGMAPQGLWAFVPTPSTSHRCGRGGTERLEGSPVHKYHRDPACVHHSSWGPSDPGSLTAGLDSSHTKPA